LKQFLNKTLPTIMGFFSLERRVERKISVTRLLMLTERLWPRLMPLLGLASAFLIISWFGLWPQMPDILRFGLLGIFAILVMASLLPFRDFSIPSRMEARSRLERNNPDLHRPVTTREDSLATDSDAVAQAIWQAHKKRTREHLNNLNQTVPEAGTVKRDPWGLRAPLILLLVVSFFAADGSHMQRLEQAFAKPSASGFVPVRIDAWVSPPNYTGRPPIFLTKSGDETNGVNTQSVKVPKGSELTVRTGPAGSLSVTYNGEAIEANGEMQSNAPTDRLYSLMESGTLAVTNAGRTELEVAFSIEPDTPPTIALVGDPEAGPAGSLTLQYKITDDFGASEAYATLKTKTDTENALVEAPEFPLVLPADTRNGETETTRDLSDHPWAGSDIQLQLHVKDSIEQSNTSEIFQIVLPQRPFSDELALSLVEQRRILALDKTTKPDVLTALEALAIAPESFMADKPTAYLGLVSVTERLKLARDDDRLRSVLDMLWDLALFIEDGDLSRLSEALRAAQQRLQEALEQGANEQEIAELTRQLRELMKQFMAEMAQRMQSMPEGAQIPPNANMQTIDPAEMQSMLDRIEELARQGNTEAARQLLADLQRMMESMQSAQPFANNQAQQGPNPMMEALDELAEMMRQQQELMDETYRASPDQQIPRAAPDDQANPFGQQAMPNFPFNFPNMPFGRPEQNQQGQQQGEDSNQNAENGETAPPDMSDLANRQQALQQALEDLQNRIQNQGAQPGQLGEAGEAMGDATGNLQDNDGGSAVDNQSRALDALRQGAENLAQQMQQQGQGGMQASGQNGQQQGQGRRQMVQGGETPNQDPLGRERRGQTAPEAGDRTQVPTQSETQRVREILNEIRRRLGEGFRPTQELDYLERLLERFE
jgi:uncharacterized protein (TIGR02302 family)